MGTLFMIEELDQSVGKLMPQFSLPQVLEGDEEMLQISGSSIALFSQEVGNGIDIHSGQRFRLTTLRGALQ